MIKRFYIFAFLLLVSALNGYSQVNYTIGTGTSANSCTGAPAPFYDYYMSHRNQYLFLASELTAAGMAAGNITAIKWDAVLSCSPSLQPLGNFSIKIGTTSSSALTTTYLTTITHTVRSSSTYTVTSGTNTFTLPTSFYWNGSDNIVIDLCHDNIGLGYTRNALTNYTTTSFNSVVYSQSDATSQCSASSGTAGTTRPNTTFSLIASSPCVAPSVTTSNVTSQSAKLNWTSTTGAVTYDYAVTTSATWPPSGTNTAAMTATVNGLTPNTDYYAHVRTKCTAPAQSAWATTPFRTNPPCTKPVGLTVKDLTVKSAKLVFRRIAHANSYTWRVDTDRDNPSGMDTVKTTNDTTFSASNLEEGTKYYVHILVNCPGGETSEWLLDSFTTLVTCRPPVLKVDYQHIDRGLVYWDHVRTGVSYEYELSGSPTPMGKGTEIQNNSVMAFPLKPGQVYYFHARSKCIDQGINNISEWATTSFKTFPLSISTLDGKNLVLDVYPNPVKDVLNIEVKGALPDADATVTISDVTGKVLQVLPLNGKQQHEISMNGYAAGVYTIKYADKTHTEATRITKQ